MLNIILALAFGIVSVLFYRNHRQWQKRYQKLLVYTRDMDNIHEEEKCNWLRLESEMALEIVRLEESIGKDRRSRIDTEKQYMEVIAALKIYIDTWRTFSLDLVQEKNTLESTYISINNKLEEECRKLSEKIIEQHESVELIKELIKEFRMLQNRIVGHAQLYKINPDAVDFDKVIRIILAQNRKVEKVSRRVSTYLSEA